MMDSYKIRKGLWLLTRICGRKKCDETGPKKDGEVFSKCDWREAAVFSRLICGGSPGPALNPLKNRLVKDVYSIAGNKGANSGVPA
jgi:hypothetical protein